jgi:hypothetical protein
MESIESVRTEYIQRNKISQCDHDDERMISAIHNLRKNYASELEKRKTIKLIDPSEAFVSAVIKKQEEPKKKEKETVAVVICKAIKMDGNPCTTKTKFGCVFCGRHLPKQQ